MKKRTLISILLTLSVTLGILLAMGLTASAAEYDLWIRDTQVTDENKDDIRGDGVFHYISGENKLVISGDYYYNANSEEENYFNGSTIVNQIDGLVIDVVKNSSIEGIWNLGSALESDGNVTIQGAGDLLLSNRHAFGGGIGIYINNHLLTVDHMCLTASGSGYYAPMGGMKEPDAAPGISGYKEKASMRIISSYVKTNTVSGLWRGISLEGCSVVYPEDAYIQDGSIYDSSGKLASTVVIAPDPTHVVIPNALNVRKEPGTDSERIGGVTAEKKVTVMETQGEWSKIVYGTDFGWVQSKYLNPLTNPFEDVYESDDYYDAVLWAYYADPQVTNGMDETHFGPGLTVTRGQTVTFLWRSQGCPEPSSMYNPFVDVPSTEYYFKPVLWAVENGITKGVDETHFNPMDTLTTQHIVTFLYRTKNPGMDGWDGEAAAWAGFVYGGKPFGIDVAVDMTPCPRSMVVQFLWGSREYYPGDYLHPADYRELTDSWKEIIASVNDGTYKEKYRIGDKKSLDLGSEGVVEMQIAAFDADELADGSGKAAITWISGQLLDSEHEMNDKAKVDPSDSSKYMSGTGGIGGWECSDMRIWLKESVRPLIPETVRNAIRPVTKYSNSLDVSKNPVMNVSSIEDVWIPSSREVFGSSEYETKGPAYTELFRSDNARIRERGDYSDYWYLRSVKDYTSFDAVSSLGGFSGISTHLPYGVVIGFCI